MPDTFSNISDILDEIVDYGKLTADYYDKYVHKIPDVISVERIKFLVEMAKGKKVLDIGCAGPVNEMIAKHYSA